MLLVLLKKTNYNTKISSLDGKIAKINSDIKEFSKESLFVFSEDGSQAYLIFQPLYRYFKTITNTNYILSWKSKGLSDESIKSPTTSNNNLNPELSHYDSDIRVKFTGSCLKQQKITYAHKKVVNIYIVYELALSTSQIDDPTLKNCLSGAVTLTKNADVDTYRYSGYGIGFDRKGSFSFPGGGYGENVVIFGADMNSSRHVDNKGKDILILGVGPTQGLGEHSLTAEKI